ncbi:anaerobic ribonucleoside-triphosphate reductase activating protein [Candidatus Babeliales bacterium]|nr:anaerobic ribonucleoside-triphosphate reductase activating protein [Candidatus Babeliales bacterium]
MQIKSIQTTLIDYPGHIAAIVFVGGCNFRCDYCYNKELVNHPETQPTLTDEEIFSYLNGRKNLIEGLVITGGEPTIQKHLKDFIINVRALGLKIKLDTNGYLPSVLKNLLDLNLIDYVAMDVKAPLHKYSEVVGVNINTDKILESINLLKNGSVAYEFRTTVWDKGFSQQDFIDIYELVKGAPYYYLQNSYTIPCAGKKYSYEPMSKKDILPVVDLGKKYVSKIDLRGSWN